MTDIGHYAMLQARQAAILEGQSPAVRARVLGVRPAGIVDALPKPVLPKCCAAPTRRGPPPIPAEIQRCTDIAVEVAAQEWHVTVDQIRVNSRKRRDIEVVLMARQCVVALVRERTGATHEMLGRALGKWSYGAAKWLLMRHAEHIARPGYGTLYRLIRGRVERSIGGVK